MSGENGEDMRMAAVRQRETLLTFSADSDAIDESLKKKDTAELGMLGSLLRVKFEMVATYLMSDPDDPAPERIASIVSEIVWQYDLLGCHVLERLKTVEKELEARAQRTRQKAAG